MLDGAGEAVRDGREGPARSRALYRHVRGVFGRLSWGLGDQAVSSLSNFIVGIYVAKELGTVEFGIFSLAWVTYGVMLNVSRGLGTDPLMVRFSTADADSWRTAVSRSGATALAVGVAAGACCVLAGIALGPPVGIAFIGLGIVLPGLLLQDSWRFAFFAAGRGRHAFINDAVWAVALIPALVIATSHPSVLGFMLAWGASGAVAALVGCAQAKLIPRLSGLRTWLSQQRDLGPRYLVENVSLSGASQLRMYGLGAVAGLAGVGAVRGAELLLGPFIAVMMGISLVVVPEAARALRRSTRALANFCLLIATVLAVSAAVWGLILILFLPDSIGTDVLGSVWLPASALLIPATLAEALASFSVGLAAGLRALGAARRSLRAQLLVSMVSVTGGVLGAVFGDALGSMWGFAIAKVLALGFWWWHLRAGLREHERSIAGATPVEADEEMRTA